MYRIKPCKIRNSMRQKLKSVNLKHITVGRLCRNSWSRLRVSRAADCDRAFCDQNKVCALSRLRKIQAFWNSYSDWSHVDSFFQLGNQFLRILEIIWGAETLGWVSLNYLSIRFISIHIIHIRFVWWTTWGWPWSERFPWTPKVRSTTGTMESASWPAPKDILHVK